MTKDERKAYMKAWKEAHKEVLKAKNKEYYQANKEQMKAKKKAWHEAHKDQAKAYRQAHKDERNAYMKAWYEAHKDECNAYMKAWYEANKDERKARYQANKDKIKAYKHARKEQAKAYMKAYLKSDLNSLGQTKASIRQKSQRYLKKYGTKIPDYEIHHCCTYDDPSKFIYCSKELHLKIHQYLRDNNIDADSDHYEQIKHLLDDSVVMFNV